MFNDFSLLRILAQLKFIVVVVAVVVVDVIIIISCSNSSITVNA